MPNIIATIPAKNEQATISQVIKGIKEVFDQLKYPSKILVLDDASTDSTAEVAKRAGAIVYSLPVSRGLANVFRTELKKSLELGADIIVHIDADNQYMPSEIPRLIEPIIEKKADLVLGNRFGFGKPPLPWLKRWGNRAFSRTISKIINQKIYDCQTGFRCFTRELAEKVNIISTHTYTQEQIIRAVKENFKVKEVPVHFLVRTSGKSRLLSNPFEYALKAWINILRIYRDYEPLKFFGLIGMIPFSIGFILGCYFLYLQFTTGIQGHIALLFLTMLLIITGFQILTFGFLADMQRK